MNLHDYRLHLQLLLITITTVVAGPICNRTTPFGNSLSFYNTQERTSVTIDRYLSITCCAEFHDSIEWYKDKVSPPTRIVDKPSGSIPNNCSNCFEQYYFRFAEGGQVLKVYESIGIHAGLYICIIKNGSVSKIFQQEVEIKLRTNEKEYTDHVKADSCKQYMKAHIGANVTVCCTFMQIQQDGMDIRWEARINNKPTSFHLKAQDVAVWAYTTFFTNISAIENKNGKNGLSEVTSYLTLYNITRETYGTYIATSWSKQNTCHANCTIVISQDIVVESKLVEIVVGMVMSFILATCMMFFLAAMYIWKRYHMTIWLFVSDLLPINDDMEEAMYDAFISHSNTDEDRLFAIQVLRPLLERHDYTTCIDVINFPAGGIRFDDGIAAVNASRRCILVLSPDYANNVHCRYELDAALHDMKKLRSRCSKVIPVTFKECSKDNLNNSKHLQRVLVAVRKLKWTSDNVEEFEKNLVSRMPPMNLEREKVQKSRTEVSYANTTELNNKKSRFQFERFYNPMRSLYRETSVISNEHPSLSM